MKGSKMHVFGTSNFIVAAVTVLMVCITYGAIRLAEWPYGNKAKHGNKGKVRSKRTTNKKYAKRKTARSRAPKSVACVSRTSTGGWPICPPSASPKVKRRQEQPVDENILRGKADIRRTIHALLHSGKGDRRKRLEHALFLYHQAPTAVVSLLWLPITALTKELSELTQSFLAENFTRLEETGDPKAYRALKNFFEKQVEFESCNDAEIPAIFHTRMTEWELCMRVNVSGLTKFDELRRKHHIAPQQTALDRPLRSATSNSRTMRTPLATRAHAQHHHATTSPRVEPQLLAARPRH